MSRQWSTILQLHRATNLTLYAYTSSTTQYDDSSSCSSDSVAVLATVAQSTTLRADVVVVDAAIESALPVDRRIENSTVQSYGALLALMFID